LLSAIELKTDIALRISINEISLSKHSSTNIEEKGKRNPPQKSSFYNENLKFHKKNNSSSSSVSSDSDEETTARPLFNDLLYQ